MSEELREQLAAELRDMYFNPSDRGGYLADADRILTFLTCLDKETDQEPDTVCRCGTNAGMHLEDSLSNSGNRRWVCDECGKHVCYEAELEGLNRRKDE